MKTSNCDSNIKRRMLSSGRLHSQVDAALLEMSNDFMCFFAQILCGECNQPVKIYQ